MNNKNYPLCLHIQPMDGITYKESLLAFYAVVQDLEKGFEKPIGGIKIEGKSYVVDWIFAKEENGLCKPDLIKEKLYMKMQKKRKKETKAYYDEVKRREKEKTTSLQF